MKKSILSVPYLWPLCIIFATMLWGSAFPVIKLGTAYLGIEKGVFSSILFAGIRFFFAGLLVLCFCKVRRIPLRVEKGNFPYVLAFALIGTMLQYLCQYVGLAHTKGSVGALITQSNVFIVVLVAPLFFKNKRLSLWEVLGVMIGFFGIVSVNFDSSMQLHFALNGELMLVLSSLCGAANSIITKKVADRTEPMVASGMQQVIGGGLLILMGLLGGGTLGSFDRRGILCLCHLIIVAAVSQTIWAAAHKYHDVTKIAVFKFAIPLFGVIFSGILLGERVWEIQNLIALVSVCAGVIITNQKKPILLFQKKDRSP